MTRGRAIAKRLLSRAFREHSVTPSVPEEAAPKTWEHSQEYELHHAITFMESERFKDLLEAFSGGRSDAATGFVNELVLKEFFQSDRSDWDVFKAQVAGKVGVDIGPCVGSPLADWSFLSKRIAIEPLGEEIVAYQKRTFGHSLYETMELRAVGADVYMADLEGAIDGVIYCRNMLDHTPRWPVVLSNIGLYAAKGCHLLLWTDYNHHGIADDGHYEICQTVDEMKRLVRGIGFDLRREYSYPEREEANWGCIAIKV